MKTFEQFKNEWIESDPNNEMGYTLENLYQAYENYTDSYEYCEHDF